MKDCLYDGKILSKEEANCIYQHYKGHEDHLGHPTSSDREDLKTCDPLSTGRLLIADQVQKRINRCDEVMERKDYIRMEQEIIRTLDPKIICSACQKFTNFFFQCEKKSLMNNIHLKLKHHFFLHKLLLHKNKDFTHEEVAK